jgi:hypothetical protein
LNFIRAGRVNEQHVLAKYLCYFTEPSILWRFTIFYFFAESLVLWRFTIFYFFAESLVLWRFAIFYFFAKSLVLRRFTILYFLAAFKMGVKNVRTGTIVMFLPRCPSFGVSQ